MKIKISIGLIAFGLLLPSTALPEDLSHISGSDKTISIYPDDGTVNSLHQITVNTSHTQGFGAFVYMPSLYEVNEDGSIGAEISACELADSSARGKDTLEFNVITPPSRPGKYAFVIKDNSFSLIPSEENASDGAFVTDDDLTDNSDPRAYSARSGFKNYPVNLDSDSLRILHISNSYGENMLRYVDDILKSSEMDVSKVVIERLMYSGGTFKNWVDVYEDNNPNAYSFFKMAGDLKVNAVGWEGAKYDGSKFRGLLADNKWDLILINQGSLYAPLHENWTSSEPGGHLHELLDIIRTYHPLVPVGVLLIHSYDYDYPSNSQRWTSIERAEKICDGVKWLASAYDIDFVIPYGTAIQNLRLTHYNNEYELTGDGSHLAGGLPLYAAGCCYVEKIFGPRTGKSIWGNSFRLPHPTVQYSDKYDDCIIPVDDRAAEIAQKAAFLACHNMYEYRNPEITDLTDYRYGENLNQEKYQVIYELNSMDSASVNQVQKHTVYGPTGILIGKEMPEEKWRALPEGLYIRNGEKIYKSK